MAVLFSLLLSLERFFSIFKESTYDVSIPNNNAVCCISDFSPKPNGECFFIYCCSGISWCSSADSKCRMAAVMCQFASKLGW